MMHYSNCVITLQDTNTGKTFREYEHAREGDVSRSRVPIPFGTEYSFRIKTTDGKRRRVQFWIDGSSIGELIFSGPTDTLERFIQSSERFKFVKKDHGAVQDPGSPDNGHIVVKVWTEKDTPKIDEWKKICDQYPPYRPSSWPYNPAYPSWPTHPWWDHQITLGSSTPMPPTTYGMSNMSHTTLDCCVESCSPTRGLAPEAAISDGLKGATVGGANSNQTFGTTTWAGDDQYSEFRFTVHAPKTGEEPKVAAKVQYCHGCGTKLAKDAKFCHECGSLLPVI
jgi:hypothetical protein